MIPLTPPRPPLQLDNDPLVSWLLERADPQLIAPARPRVVTSRCDGNLSLLAAWDALHELTLLYEHSGRNDFSAQEVSRAPSARGISRGRLPEYIRRLSELGLVDVVGHSAIPGLFDRRTKSQMQKAHYRIDYERLYLESAKLAADLLRNLGLPAPRQQHTPPGQHSLPFLSEQAPRKEFEQLNVGAHTYPSPQETDDRPTSPGASPNARYTPSLEQPTSQGAGLNPYGRGPIPTDDGIQPRMVSPQDAPTPVGVRQVAAGRSVAPMDGRGQHPRMLGHPLASPPDARSSTTWGRSPTPPDAVGWVDGVEGRMSLGRVGALDELAPLTRGETVVLVQQTVQEALAPLLEIKPLLDGLLVQREASFAAPTSAAIGAAQQEPVPSAPLGEPEITEGPFSAWNLCTGAPATGREQAQLAELLRRYEASSNGHAHYWLARVIAQACIDDKPLTPAYLDGIMRRLKRDGWTSEVLAQRRGDAHPVAPAESSPANLAQADEHSGLSGASQPFNTSLSPDLKAEPAVADYLADAPPGTTLLPEWAEAIKETVTNRELWKTVRDNWRRRPRSDYSNVEGMLDRYRREAAALRRRGDKAPDIAAVTTGQGERDRLYAEVGRRLDQAYHGQPCRQDVLAFLGVAVYDRGLSEADVLREVAERYGPPPCEEEGGAHERNQAAE